MKKKTWSALALALVVVAWSIGDKERGNRLYRAGNYAAAAEAYAKALKNGDDSPALHYDYATALLRLGRYADAEQHFRAALKNVEPDLRERTLYNLGNRYLYHARGPASAPSTPGAGPSPSPGGNAAQATGEPDSRALLDAAIKAYQEALRIDPKDGYAKWNLELALKERQQKGGGGAQQKKGGGGGGQQKNPNPQANENRTPRPQMNESQADRILSAAENDERQLYKDKVRQGNREVPVTRDW